jgi:L-amino acid N-acyltransferase YncA
MSERFVRAGILADAARIASIYNQGMEDRVATFETERRDEAAILDWFERGYPVLVSGEANIVMAYAVAFPYRNRPCYHGVREFSVYAAREGRGRGFGTLALEALITEAQRRQWWKLVSRVFPENAASRKLLGRLGFREVGIYEKHGRLDGVWRDVVIVEKLLI